jgi:hypothetical protein
MALKFGKFAGEPRPGDILHFGDGGNHLGSCSVADLQKCSQSDNAFSNDLFLS